MAKSNKIVPNVEIQLDKFHANLKGKALVPPEWREINFGTLTEGDKAYLLKYNFAVKNTQEAESSTEK